MYLRPLSFQQQKGNDMPTNDISLADVTSFVKVGNDIYSLEKVSDKGFEYEQQIINYHRKILADTLEKEQNVFQKERLDDWGTQINQVTQWRNQARNRNNFRIDQNNHGQMFMSYKRGRPSTTHMIFLECLAILYEPTEMLVYGEGSRSSVARFIESLPFSIFLNQQTIIKFKCPFEPFPLIVGRDVKGRTVYTPFQMTPHTFGGERNVCSGSYNNGLWINDIAELTERFNRINTTSLASNQISISPFQIIEFDTFLESIDLNTVQQGATPWTTE